MLQDVNIIAVVVVKNAFLPISVTELQDDVTVVCTSGWTSNTCKQSRFILNLLKLKSNSSQCFN